MSHDPTTPRENGKHYWRSLVERDGIAPAGNHDPNHTPDTEPDTPSGMKRREFLSLMGASLALAGLTGCRRPVEKIIPYVVAPEEIIPGIPEYYATTLPLGLDAVGLVVENHEGRPTKIEGNPDHPASRGKANTFTQASILNLYDPDRSQAVRYQGEERSWEEFVAAWQELYPQYEATGGEGLAILSEAVSSPTFSRLKQAFTQRFPKAIWATYEPVSDENVTRGIELATGRTGIPIYHFDRAQVIVALDSDFLQMETGNIRHARDFADGRRVSHPQDTMNRLYVVESGLTVTGGMADHRLRLQSRLIGAFTAALALELSRQGLKIPGVDALRSYADHSFDRRWLQAVAEDLLAHRGQSLIVAGRRQPPAVHALVLAINHALKNIGATVEFRSPDRTLLPRNEELQALSVAIHDGQIDTLFILGGNPVYNTPEDWDFGPALARVATTIHLSSHYDETSRRTTWHIPEAHFLESWGDAQALDGTLSVIQPQIEPLFGGKSKLEVLHTAITGDFRSGYELVRETWRTLLPGDDFEHTWRRVLHDGVYPQAVVSPWTPKVKTAALRNLFLEQPFPTDTADSVRLEVVFQASTRVYDGRFANNGWLQELPDPITKLTWDNAALLSPRTARELGVSNEDLVTLTYRGRTLQLPVWIVPGQADYSVALELGYGREAAGRVGTGVGANTYRLRTSQAPDFDRGLQLSPTGRTYSLACTQSHHGLDQEKLAREGIQKRLPVIVREGTLAEYRHDPEFVHELAEQPPLVSMWEEHQYNQRPQWGMTIDLTVCTGCNACTIACQGENNIPIVGKEEVRRGREMHWIRLDRYYRGDPDNPELVVQPVACQQCEMAPCEQVCPVVATSHTEDGLNGMTYNRCIGTRYCANNCPYKVRRFNFYNYTKDWPEIVQMARNPDVTVRFRGVMEKCTYCVQRINQARIAAKKEDRPIRDGEVLTACQQTCPTDAIVFGDLLDPDSRVAQIKQQERNYALLGELNTRPRTTFLARLRNPNPALEEA
jgi:molybdopterin-containing oxidoreductase family iron-sulfur binding subunit